MPLLSRDLRHAARRAACTAGLPALVLVPLWLCLSLADVVAGLSSLVVLGLAAGATAPLERAVRRQDARRCPLGLALACWALWLAGLACAAGQFVYTRTLLSTRDVHVALDGVAWLGSGNPGMYAALWVPAAAATAPATILALGRAHVVGTVRALVAVIVPLVVAPLVGVTILEVGPSPGPRTLAAAPIALLFGVPTAVIAALPLFFVGFAALGLLRFAERTSGIAMRRLRRRLARARTAPGAA